MFDAFGIVEHVSNNSSVTILQHADKIDANSAVLFISIEIEATHIRTDDIKLAFFLKH